MDAVTDRTTAVSRILATSGIISQTDRDAVLLEASKVLAKLRGTSPKGDIGTLAAALVCMSEDVANRIASEESSEGLRALHLLKSSLCERYQAEEVNRLRRELEVIS